MGWDVSDMRSFAGQVRNTKGAIGARAALALRKTVADVRADAVVNAPVDTGFLRNSIESTFIGSGAAKSMTGMVGVGANYAVYLEFGTSKMPAQPFFFPAVDRHESAFFAALDQAFTL